MTPSLAEALYLYPAAALIAARYFLPDVARLATQPTGPGTR
ncbi:MAG: hypothetical protein ABIR76_16040 [Polaromonas sp.]